MKWKPTERIEFENELIFSIIEFTYDSFEIDPNSEIKIEKVTISRFKKYDCTDRWQQR